MPREIPSAKEYQHMVAIYLRHKEADLRRGQKESLDELERLSDDELLRKWAWMATIGGFIACYFVAPFLLMAIGHILPQLLSQLLWLIVKVAMFLEIAMFAIAVHFTLRKSNQ